MLLAVAIPVLSSRRVKLSSPMFNHLCSLEFVPLLYALLKDRMASEFTSDWSNRTPTHTSRVEDLPKPAQVHLQLADAL
jgi:hypothetical protein